MILAKPIKTTGRVVMGPRLVGSRYARLVALVDGSGLIQLYDESSGLWSDAGESCGFADFWSAAAAPPTFAARFR